MHPSTEARENQNTGIAGPGSPRDRSIEIEIPGGFGDRFLARLLQCFVAASRQRVAAGPLRIHGLLENRFAASRLFGQDPLSVSEFGFVRAFGLVMRDYPAEVQIDHQD